jgi:hypothetical protein
MSLFESIAFMSTALATVALVACAVLSFALLEERRPWFEETRAIKLLGEILDQIGSAVRREATVADLRALATSCEFARKAALHTTAVDQESITALQLVSRAAVRLSEARTNKATNGATAQEAHRALTEFRHSAAYCRQALSTMAERTSLQHTRRLPATETSTDRQPDMAA